MASLEHMLPVTAHTEAIIDGHFSMTFECFADTKQQEPFPLDDITVSMTIADIFSLAEGDGITLDRATGVITVTLTSEQTRAVLPTSPNPGHHYALRLEDTAGVVAYPVSGDITFRHP